MEMMEKIKEIRNKKNASLVVAYQNGTIEEYYQERIIDLVSILKENPEALKQSIVADKVVGKVAASVMAVAGVSKLHANTLSKIAIPVLEQAGITYSYDSLVDYIKNKDQTGMCPMENKYQNEMDVNKIYKEMVK